MKKLLIVGLIVTYTLQSRMVTFTDRTGAHQHMTTVSRPEHTGFTGYVQPSGNQVYVKCGIPAPRNARGTLTPTIGSYTNEAGAMCYVFDVDDSINPY